MYQILYVLSKIGHVTKPGANLFLELGFSAEEAKRLQAASRKQINDTRLLKQQLIREGGDSNGPAPARVRRGE
jgi:hypothetical protein